MLLQQRGSRVRLEDGERERDREGDLISYFIDLQKLESNKTKTKISYTDRLLCNDAST